MSTDTTPINLESPVAPEMNLYFFYQQIVDDVGGLDMEILEFLVAAGTSRGWFPSMVKVSERFSEEYSAQKTAEAIAKLRRLRLLSIGDDDKIGQIIGGITHEKTCVRAITEDNVAFYLVSALDALTIAPTLQKEVRITTTCGMTDETIELKISAEGDLTGSTPHEVTAFVPGWDGEAPLAETMQAGRFFKNDEQLHLWQQEHGEPDGLPLTQDTIRNVGMEMARAIAALYVRMSIR